MSEVFGYRVARVNLLSHAVGFRDVSVELARLNSQLLHKFEYGFLSVRVKVDCVLWQRA